MKKRGKIREHMFVKKLPVLAAILICAIGMFAILLISTILNLIIHYYVNHSYPLDGEIGLMIAAVIVMLVYKRWFSPEFRGFFFGGKPAVGFLPGLIFVAFLAVPFVINTLSGAGVHFKTPTFAIFISALATGIHEESAMRGLLLGTLVKEWKNDYKKVILAVLISSVVFGFIHMINVTRGADVLVSLNQSVYATGIGVFFAALFLRSGNLLAPVFFHFLADFIWMLSSSSATADGLITAATVKVGDLIYTGLCMIMLVIGLWLLRPKKFDEVKERLNGMWQDNTVSAEHSQPLEKANL